MRRMMWGVALCAGVALAVEHELDYEVTWVGNDAVGKPEWVPHNVEAYIVPDDGDQFTNVNWEEGGGNVMHFDRDGKWRGAAMHTHGWGNQGGEAVAVNTKYAFLALRMENEGGGLKDPATWPPAGSHWKGISRRLRADFTKAAPFEGGKGGKGDTLAGCFKVVEEYPVKGSATIRGVYATEAELFVAVREKNAVHVYDAETMEEKRSWAVERPDRLAMDAERKTLWVLQAPEDLKTGAWALAACDPQDGKVIRRMELDKAVRPSAISIDAKNRLLVCDTGASQQVLIFEGVKDGRPRQRGTFGERNGIFGGPVPGRVGERRFNNLIGAGCDAQGNFYVACNGGTAEGGTVIESYTPGGKLRWRRYGLFFVDVADLDAATEQVIYSKDRRFEVDFTKPPGEQMRYAAYTANPWKYPDDPRLRLWPSCARFTRVQGQPLLFVTSMSKEFILAYRFNPKTDGETAIPAMYYTRNLSGAPAGWPPHRPEGKTWVWTDLNADGQFQPDEYQELDRAGGSTVYSDDAATIWQVGPQAAVGVPFKGFTAKGVPTWAWDAPVTHARPKELTQLRRFKLDRARDIALFGGATDAHKNQHWKPMGPALCAYKNASTANPELMWSVILPYDAGGAGHESKEPMSFEVAGDHVFVCYTRGLKEDNVRFAFVKVFALADGRFIGNMASEGRTGEIGLLDLEESMRVRLLKDGTYVVFLEDDYKGKNVIFKWKPQK